MQRTSNENRTAIVQRIRHLERPEFWKKVALLFKNYENDKEFVEKIREYTKKLADRSDNDLPTALEQLNQFIEDNPKSVGRSEVSSERSVETEAKTTEETQSSRELSTEISTEDEAFEAKGSEEMVYYHVSKFQNKSSIQDEGLDPSKAGTGATPMLFGKEFASNQKKFQKFTFRLLKKWRGTTMIFLKKEQK